MARRPLRPRPYRTPRLRPENLASCLSCGRVKGASAGEPLQAGQRKRLHECPWLCRVVNPGVPWFVALPCNVLAGSSLVLLAFDPAGNLPIALAILLPAAIALYGTAFVLWWRHRRWDCKEGQDS